MGGSPSIPTPPPLPTPPPAPSADKEDPAIAQSRERYKMTLAQRTTRQGNCSNKTKSRRSIVRRRSKCKQN